MIRLENLPNAQKRGLDLVREVAAEKELRPFLVGGPVRDVMLGRHDVIDIDLTLEDGASTLARAVAKKINGRLRSFPQFLTYKISAEGLPEIDIATARKERYRSPGALPSIARERIWRELFLAFEEESAPNSVAALSAAGVLEVLFGKRPFDRDLEIRLQRTALALAGTTLDKQVMYTAALLHGDASP